MKELTRVETSTLVGGRGIETRITRQLYKCLMGSVRACRRANRMLNRIK